MTLLFEVKIIVAVFGIGFQTKKKRLFVLLLMQEV
jgi:hypothetical protein